MSLCRTCFDICETDCSSPIEGELRNMLIFSIPELNLDITENPVLCKPCQTTLIGVNEFKKKCLSTQQKILIFTNQSVKPEVKSIEPVPTPTKVVEKVAPFKLKLKNKYSDTSEADSNINSKNNKLELRKRRYSETVPTPTLNNEPIKSQFSNVTDTGSKDQEDFLSLLDNSDNVCNPKVDKLSPLRKTDGPNSTKTKQNPTNAFECKMCNKSYSNKYYLKVHKISSAEHRANVAKASANSTPVQTSGHLYRCDSCSFSTKYKIGLNKHYPNCPNRKTINNSSEDSNDTKKAGSSLVCRICSYVAFNNSVLAIHMSKKHNTAWNIYKCNRCSYQTTTIVKLREHATENHNKEVNKKKKVVNKSETNKVKKEKIFTCGYSGCGKGFISKKGWMLHQNKHSLSSLRKECPVCHKQFENGRGIKQHIKSHLKNKGIKTKMNKVTSSKEEYKKPGPKSVENTAKNKKSMKDIEIKSTTKVKHSKSGTEVGNIKSPIEIGKTKSLIQIENNKSAKDIGNMKSATEMDKIKSVAEGGNVKLVAEVENIRSATDIENVSINNAIEESESTGQIFIRMDRVFTTTSNFADKTKQISEYQENSEPTNVKENMEDIYQHSEDSSSQSEQNDNETERPMFEVEFVGTISDNEDDAQIVYNDEKQVDSETSSQKNQIEEEDQDNSALSQQTIILS